MPDVAIANTSNCSVEDLYKELIATTKALLEGERDYIANLSNISSLVYNAYKERSDKRKDANWVGFYLNRTGKLLVLGPFQGKVACVRIPFGKGVCGDAAASGKTLLVPNVHEYPGHIACDSASNSEIVVPLKDENGKIYGVFDLDNASHEAWTEEDQKGLETIADLLVKGCDWPF